MNPTPGRPNGPRIWGVGALLQAAADLLAARFGLLRVSGEISALSEAASGHRYFSLKDDQTGGAVMRCAMFRRAAVASTVPLRDGIKVEAVGRLAIYGPRGDLQFIVESVHPVGAGSLHEEFLRLKARLAAEGWFDADRKRSLPSHPRRLRRADGDGDVGQHAKSVGQIGQAMMPRWARQGTGIGNLARHHIQQCLFHQTGGKS